jgi:hypothetical protein
VAFQILDAILPLADLGVLSSSADWTVAPDARGNVVRSWETS